MNEYTCICGKCFNKFTSLASHKSQCKIYKVSIKDRLEKEKQKKQEHELRRLPNGMFKCENCEKEHDGSYGSGRFCSDHCRRSFIAKQRHRLGTLKPHLEKMHSAQRKKDGWKCSYCNCVLITKQQLYINIYINVIISY